MRRIVWLTFITAWVLAFSSCTKDPLYEYGNYVYENNDLTRVDYVNGFVINWSDTTIGEEQRSVILNLISNMAKVEGGSFMMGAQNMDEQSDNFDAEAHSDESPVHEVTVGDFYIGKYEITQREWRAVMGYDLNWSEQYGLGDLMPAYNMSRTDALRFVEKLSALTRLSFDLPSEAQWEFAARGGNDSQHYRYSGSHNVDDVAWHVENSTDKVHVVGEKQANELGLYDMSGNLWEWCLDAYGQYLDVPQTDPVSYGENMFSMRGGAWTYLSTYSRVTCRDSYDGNAASISNGLRVIMKIQ